jgi:predicted GTPase
MSKKVKKSLKDLVPNTPVLLCNSVLSPMLKGKSEQDSLEQSKKLVKGKRALCIDDGPTLTHGGMPYGAAYVMAKNLEAGEIVDPKPFAKGELKSVFDTFTHLEHDLPAMGYGQQEIRDLQATVSAASKDVDVILIGTPMDLPKIIKIDKPIVTVTYALQPHQPDIFNDIIQKTVEKKSQKSSIKRAQDVDKDVDKDLSKHLKSHLKVAEEIPVVHYETSV